MHDLMVQQQQAMGQAIAGHVPHDMGDVSAEPSSHLVVGGDPMDEADVEPPHGLLDNEPLVGHDLPTLVSNDLAPDFEGEDMMEGFEGEDQIGMGEEEPDVDEEEIMQLSGFHSDLNLSKYEDALRSQVSRGWKALHCQHWT